MFINRQMHKEDVVHICNGILLSHKKNKILPFTATWMDLEIIILSEVIQTERQIGYHLYVESKNICKSTYKQDRNRFKDTENIFMVTKGRRGER